MSLNPRFILGSLDLTEWPFMVKRGDGGVDTGAPENVSTIIASLLQDGEIVSVDRSSNRTLSLTVYIEEADLAALSDAETLLIAETSKPRNTFSIDPGDGYGAVTVFDTFRVQERFVRSDDEEEVGLRRYDLTIPALPFGRSEIEIVSTALTSAVTPVTTVINDGSSATGWTQRSSDTASESAATASSGAVVGTLGASFDHNFGGDGVYTAGGSLIYRPASPVDMSTTGYLQVDWTLSLTRNNNTPLRVFADGVELARVADVSGAASGFYRTIYVCPDASVSEFRVRAPNYVRGLPDGGSDAGVLSVDQLVRTNQAPSASTLRQKMQSLQVLGSARTQGSLQVSHETSALGDVIVYTYPDLGDGYTPNLRQWLTASGTVNTDTALVSGARNAWSGTTFSPPQRTLRPGPYLLAARVRSTSGTGDKTLAATGMSAVVNFPAINVWQIATVGVMTVGDHIPGTSFSQTVSLTGGTNVEVDEAWLFYVGDDAHLTQASLGTAAPSAAGSSNRLWIDTPTLSHPYPAMWRGTLADKTDARSALDANTEWADHTFSPPGVTLFTVTSNALDAAVTLRYFPRWFGNAGNVA